MSIRYKIDTRLELLDPDDTLNPESLYVEVLSDAEFDAEGAPVPDEIHDQIEELLKAESCYIDGYPDYVIGSIAVPDKKDVQGDRELFSFYWTTDRLIFIDESHRVEEVLRAVKNSRVLSSPTTAACMLEFLRQLVLNDPTWLGRLEDQMENAEEAMLDDSRDNTSLDEINGYRRITIRVTTYYQQLSEMAVAISSNDNEMMNPEEAQSFETITNFCDRLVNRAETIREYSLQLRELHQSQIDIEQNNTMQLLTIVTVILAPLTLIAGWFGMNFTNIPGVNEPWGFSVICVVGLLMTVLLILWFHRKKWL